MANNSSDSDSEIEEEVVVFADFGGLLDEDLLNFPNLEVKLIGVETNKPILQLGGQLFQGTWDEMMGTGIIFEETYDKPIGDPVFDQQPDIHLNYLCKTVKQLNMERIFVDPKNNINEANEPVKQRTIPMCESLSEALNKLVEDAANLGVGDEAPNSESHSDNNDVDMPLLNGKSVYESSNSAENVV